jgi:hypothetical protein
VINSSCRYVYVYPSNFPCGRAANVSARQGGARHYELSPTVTHLAAVGLAWDDPRLEVPDNVPRDDRDGMFVAVVEGRCIQRMVPGNFGTDLNLRREPMLPAKRPVIIGRRKAGAPAVDVVKEFSAQGNIVQRRELVVQVEKDRPFLRRAG